MYLLNPVVIPSVMKQASTIVFLHGLGDTGQSWADILPELRPLHSKIICPNAPVQNVTLNQGVAMPAWFDLRPLDQPKDERGIKEAAEAIREVIQTEVDSGIPATRIVLGGFSQGGAVAVYTGLTMPYRLGGILALSTWLPLDKLINWNSIQKQTPMLQCHGDQDDMIALERAEKGAKQLAANIPNFQFKMYPDLGHTIACENELNDIHKFLADCLPEKSANNQSSKL